MEKLARMLIGPVAKRLSKHPSDYVHDVFQGTVARQLLMAGYDVYPGQTMQYLIVDFDSKSANNRVRAAQLLGSKVKFVVQKYLRDASGSLRNFD